VAPPGGAAPDSTRAPWPAPPPVTLVGLRTRFCRFPDGGGADWGVTVRVLVRLPPLKEAVITTAVVACTTAVVIANVPVKPLVGTVTLAGTPATAGLLLESEMTVVSGAGTLTMTVPLDVFPPTMVVGLTSRFVSTVGGGGACGVKLRVADQAPGTPAVLTPRTRQNWVVVPRPPAA